MAGSEAISVSANSRWNFRVVALCFSALSLSFPVAWISIAKLVMVLLFLVEIARGVRKNSQLSVDWQSLRLAYVIPWLIVLMFSSLAWTVADLNTGLHSVVKHSKLIFILVPILLIRNLSEAQIVFRAFAIGQIFLMLSAWLIFLNAPLPWATHSGGKNVVFSTYLDQSMIMATSSAVFFHLRKSGAWSWWLGIACSVSALANVLFLLEGRTAYVIVVALAGLAVAWSCPPLWRKRVYGLAAIAILVCIAWAYLHAQQNVLTQHSSERSGDAVRVYKEPNAALSSDEWRLNAWHRSLQAMALAPIAGTGAGSWKTAIAPFEGDHFVAVFGRNTIGTPHQEYLLWGVEFGILGCIALLLLFAVAVRDARKFEDSTTRALWSVLAACMISCLFNSVLYDALIGDYFCITLGLLFALGMQQQGNTLKAHSKPGAAST